VNSTFCRRDRKSAFPSTCSYRICVFHLLNQSGQFDNGAGIILTRTFVRGNALSIIRPTSDGEPNAQMEHEFDERSGPALFARPVPPRVIIRIIVVIPRKAPLLSARSDRENRLARARLLRRCNGAQRLSFA